VSPSRPVKLVRRVRAIPIGLLSPAQQLEVREILMDLLWAYLDLQAENRHLLRKLATRA
jgi:hypothetical protein